MNADVSSDDSASTDGDINDGNLMIWLNYLLDTCMRMQAMFKVAENKQGKLFELDSRVGLNGS